MTDPVPKARILARRSAFIAAAITTSACDRACGRPFACLEPPERETGGSNEPVVCLSMPIPTETAPPADAGAPSLAFDAAPQVCLATQPPAPRPKPTACLKMPDPSAP